MGTVKWSFNRLDTFSDLKLSLKTTENHLKSLNPPSPPPITIENPDNH